MKLKLLAAFVAAALAIAGLLVFTQKPPAPEVDFVTLQGETITTTDLRGKVVLVNFWATTCTSCIKEMPKLVATYERFAARGFETIAVAMDYDPPAQVEAYVARSALPFTVALDSGGAVARGFDGVRLTPTTFLIDKRGRIVHKYLGEPDFDRLHALLDELLDTPA
ncbi:MAG TPA: TlpA disulfide reductase family protein [Rhodocyclaceae bacterium]|nr:TlpA disulfide reductase family protein [Rhodocyclaceae bacterium]